MNYDPEREAMNHRGESTPNYSTQHIVGRMKVVITGCSKCRETRARILHGVRDLFGKVTPR